MNKTMIRLPVEEFEKTIEFKNFVNKEKITFVIYADFESYLKTPKEEDASFIQIHEAHSIVYYLCCSYDDQISLGLIGVLKIQLLNGSSKS